jgi:putative intracellular protease/amidase
MEASQSEALPGQHQIRAANPVALDTIDSDEFDLVFYPGGHGPMEDLAYDKTSRALLGHRLASDKPLALLCHAPVAILAATGPEGTSPPPSLGVADAYPLPSRAGRSRSPLSTVAQ